MTLTQEVHFRISPIIAVVRVGRVIIHPVIISEPQV